VHEAQLRVAHIIGSLGIGGAERHLVNLLNAMNCEFRAVILLDQKKDGPTFHDDLEPKIEQHFVNVRFRSFPLGVARLVRQLRKLRVDVVHTHMFSPNLFGTLAARLAGVPVVVTTEHGENPWKGAFHRFVERWVISALADLRLCVSERILELRRDRDGVPVEKLSVITNGTEIPAIQSHRKRTACPTVIAVGRFVAAKNYPLLLSAVARLLDLDFTFRVQILGDGPEMNSVRGQVLSLGLQDIVELPGAVTGVTQWFENADIYVNSSSREGQPVALLEAMANSLPIVATDVGASARTVSHSVGGLIVPPEDAAALAAALGQLISNYDARIEFGNNAHKRVQMEYSISSVAADHLVRYMSVLSNRKAL